jgi:hypothetical protein
VDGKITVEQIVMARLDRLEEKVDLCRTDIAGLKVKSGIWGGLAGLVPVLIGMGMWILSTGG